MSWSWSRKKGVEMEEIWRWKEASVSASGIIWDMPPLCQPNLHLCPPINLSITLHFGCNLPYRSRCKQLLLIERRPRPGQADAAHRPRQEQCWRLEERMGVASDELQDPRHSSRPRRHSQPRALTGSLRNHLGPPARAWRVAQ